MKEILAFSVARSDLDRYSPIIDQLRKSKNINVRIIASTIHYMSIFGKTLKNFDKRIKIENRAKIKPIKDSPISLARNLSEEITFFSKMILKRKPDLILVLGDRYEMLAPAIAAIPFNIPIVHLYGGAVTKGAIDEQVRHALTKISHLHLTAHQKYSDRIIKMGEEKWRVKTIGLPDLLLLKKQKIINKKKLSKILNINIENKTLLVTLHPTVFENKNVKYLTDDLLNAIEESNHQAIFTYPNSDIGNKIIIDKIKKFCKKQKKYIFIKFFTKEVYSNLLRNCSCMIGNSSSGIVEAASFKLPVINLGIRQEGKIKPKNIINTNFSKKNILKAIKRAHGSKFRHNLKNIRNPYEKNLSIKKICKFIISNYGKEKLLIKKFI